MCIYLRVLARQTYYMMGETSQPTIGTAKYFPAFGPYFVLKTVRATAKQL